MAVIPDPSGDAPLAPYITYDEMGTSGGVTSYQFYITGAGASTYSSRTIRYKLDNGDWVYSMDHDFVREDSTTRLVLTRPQGKTLTVEAWTTDEMSSLEGEHTTVVVADSEIYANKLYIPVEVSSQIKTKRPVKLYVVRHNYFDVMSEVPRSQAVVTHDATTVTITKGSSGTGGYTWAMFPIDGTDELIGKEITVSGSFTTSGSFTSGVRLWWMNSTNTGILSGPVNSIEYIGNQGSFSVSGVVPSKPSNAGKLGLLVYANIGSAAQGVFSTYSNLKITLTTKNKFDYLRGTYPSTKAGVTVTRADDGTFTASGILGSNYQVWGGYEITNFLEDGKCYVMTQSISDGNFYFQMPAHKRDNSGTDYLNISGRTNIAFICNKTKYDKYTIQFQTGTTTNWGTSSRTIAQKFQLEKANLMPSILNMRAFETGTKNGLTCSVDSDGKVTITGTASAATHFSIAYKIPAALSGQVCSQYWLGRTTGLSNMSLKKATSDVSGITTLNQTYNGRSFTVTDTMITDVSAFDVYITNGSVVDASFYYCFGIGALYSDFAPYAKQSCLRVKKLYSSKDGVSKLLYRG